MVHSGMASPSGMETIPAPSGTAHPLIPDCKALSQSQSQPDRVPVGQANDARHDPPVLKMEQDDLSGHGGLLLGQQTERLAVQRVKGGFRADVLPEKEPCLQFAHRLQLNALKILYAGLGTQGHVQLSVVDLAAQSAKAVGTKAQRGPGMGLFRRR